MSNKSVFYYFTLVTQLGLTVIICILISLYMGLWLDSKLNQKGPFTILFILMGIAAGFLSAYKQIMRKDGK